jgi:hypothetical protein
MRAFMTRRELKAYLRRRPFNKVVLGIAKRGIDRGP